MKNIGSSDDIVPLSSSDLIPTIFHEPWWLAIACGGDEREAIVESGGKIVGRLPYLQARVAGQTVLRMPTLAHVLGPAVLTLGSATSRLRREFSITAGLIERLPGAAHVHARLHGGINNTLAFKAAGYATGVDFTVEIDPKTPQLLWKQMRDKNRNIIRRAQDKVDVLEMSDIEAFLRFYDDNLHSRNLRNFYPRHILKVIIQESLRRGVGRIIATIDGSREIQSAIFTVWDGTSEYYLMSTRRSHSDNGVINILLWTAIQHAHERNIKFDMDGLHVSGNTLPNYLLLTGFGGTVRPRYFVSRTSAVMKLALHMRRVLRHAR